MLSEPFYGHYLASLQKQVMATGDTNSPNLASVLEIKLHGSCDVELVCDLAHWQTLNPQQQVGALKHEALHLVLGHVFQRGGYADKARFDLAADLVVNQYLLAEQILPHAMTLECVNKYLVTQGQPPLAPLREVRYYYLALMSLPLQNGFTQQQLSQSQHNSWGEVYEQAHAQQGLLEQQLNGKLENAAQRTELCHAIGSLPSAIVAILEQVRLARNPVLNWRRALRLFANSSRRTSVKNTLRRPSKRYGTTLGIKIQPHQRLLVALDTSASVDDEQLKLFFDEVHHIWRAGAEITIVECDTEIKRQYQYQGDMPSEISGRGGTCFDEPIHLANQQRFDGTIYFTDGEALALTVQPRKPLLWLLHSTRGTQTFDHLQLSGRVIPMHMATKR
ncbi:hypothetical protein BTO01_26235 [Vibrio jasicida]|uniref:vWA domain-containing protein n=1 Tax=Vibrio jasicida TaxID=766224 RepID=UPI000CF57D8E|nr:VWA-like domain-containing protein [Vibrio jasicida]PQJ50450.1 hypothetical protein BTO01_26235 [Vibrio jasicida]